MRSIFPQEPRENKVTKWWVRELFPDPPLSTPQTLPLPALPAENDIQHNKQHTRTDGDSEGDEGVTSGVQLSFDTDI